MNDLMTDQQTYLHLDEKASENGLAVIIFDLIRQNIESDPQRKKIISEINTKIGIVAKDESSEVKITLSFDNNKCLIFDGFYNNPEIVIETDYETLLVLPRIPMFAGYPVLTGRASLNMVLNILRGKLNIKGLVFHVFDLIKLLRLITV
jgi:hypothetical protein